MPPSDILKTGIHGLDTILLGGIPRGNVVIVTGSPGSGKTTFGVEFVYRGAREFDEPGIIISFEVSADKLSRDAAPEATRIGARRIFIDGLAGMARNGNGEARELFHVLVQALHREGVTAVFALDAPADRAAVGAMWEDFIADTIIRLGMEPVRRAVVRSLEVVKSRGQDLGRAVTLLALTGYGQPEDRRRSEDAGFDAHLVKPVTPEQIRDALVKRAAA